MAHDPSVKTAVRKHYVFDRLSLEQVAKKVGVSVPTVRRWKAEAEKQGDDWDKAQDVAVMVSGELEDVGKGILAGFLIQYKAVMEELRSNENLLATDKVAALGSLADSFAKMTASSKRLLPAVSESDAAMKTLELFAELIQTRKPALLAEFTDLLTAFEPILEAHFKGR